MYAKNINISGGTITVETNPTYTGKAGLAFSVAPSLADYGYYKIIVGHLPKEAELWNMTDALDTYSYIKIEPSDTPMVTPSQITPQVTTKNGQDTSIKTVKVGKTKILKAKAGKKRVSLTLKKIKGAKGYRIKYSTSKKFKKAKTKFIKKNKVTIKKLKKGKIYYFKAQAYKKVNGVNVYGKWSARKASKKVK